MFTPKWGLILSVVAIALVAVALPQPARADTIGPSCGGGKCLGNTYTLTASNVVVGSTDTTFDLTLTIDSSGFNAFGTGFTGVGDLLSAAVKLASKTSDIVSVSMLAAPGGTSNWTLLSGGENANGCFASTDGFVCDQSNFSNETDADLGGTLTFEWAASIVNGTGAFGTNNSHVKALFGCEDGTTENCNANNQTSADITIQGNTPAPVPEPTTFLMLGSGLLALGGLFRRRLHLRP